MRRSHLAELLGLPLLRLLNLLLLPRLKLIVGIADLFKFLLAHLCVSLRLCNLQLELLEDFLLHLADHRALLFLSDAMSHLLLAFRLYSFDLTGVDLFEFLRFTFDQHPALLHVSSLFVQLSFSIFEGGLCLGIGLLHLCPVLDFHVFDLVFK